MLIASGRGGVDCVHGRANHASLARFLQKGDEPQIMGICARVELYLNILRKSLALPNASNLHDAPDHRCMRQRAPSIFTARDMRFRAVESDGNVDVCHR